MYVCMSACIQRPKQMRGRETVLYSASKASSIHSPPPTISITSQPPQFISSYSQITCDCLSRLKGGLPLGRHQPAVTFWGIWCLTWWPKFAARLLLCETLWQAAYLLPQHGEMDIESMAQNGSCLSVHKIVQPFQE